jgi:predicted transcriptional regulator
MGIQPNGNQKGPRLVIEVLEALPVGDTFSTADAQIMTNLEKGYAPSSSTVKIAIKHLMVEGLVLQVSKVRWKRVEKGVHAHEAVKSYFDEASTSVLGSLARIENLLVKIIESKTLDNL